MAATTSADFRNGEQCSRAGASPFRYRFFANRHGKRLRPRRGGRGWVVEWGPLWSPVVLPSRGTRATTRVPTLPITAPAPTGTRGLLPKKPIPERTPAPPFGRDQSGPYGYHPLSLFDMY